MKEKSNMDIYIYIPIYIHIYCHSIYYHIFAYRFSCHGVGHSERSFKKKPWDWRRAMWKFSRPVHLGGSRGGAGAPYQRITTMQKSGTKSFEPFEPCHFVRSQSPPKKNSNKVTAFCGRSETTEKSSQLLKPLESPIGFPFSLACRADTPCRAMDGALPHVHVNGKRCRLGLARAALDLAQLGGSSWGAHRSAAQNLATCTTRMAARGGGSEILTKGVLGILRVDVPMMQWLCIFLSAWCISSLSLYFFYMILYVDIIMQQKFSEVRSQSTCGTWIFFGWKSALCRKLEPYFGHTWTPPSWLLWLMLRKRLHHLGVKRNRCELETFFHWWNLVNFMYYRCCSDIIRKCQFWYGVGPGWLMIWDESVVGSKLRGDWKPSLDWLNWAVGDVTWSWDWGRPVLGWSSLVEIIH